MKTVWIVWSEEISGVMSGIVRIEQVFSSQSAAERHKAYIESRWDTAAAHIEEHEVQDE